MAGRATTTRHPGRAAFAALVGTTIEWYDFYVYATAASLVFAQLFFPSGTSHAVGLMASFATFSVGFFARPLGGIVFGHFGDRVGRKSALVVTLLMMGVATLLVGLLPTYATIGAAAPALLVLLRFVQGLAVGGEWGGAALIAVEHAPEHRKSFYGSFAQLGNSVGALLASGIFGLMASFGSGALQAWGWRVPFLLSAVLVIVGLVVRLKVEESPVLAEAMAEAEKTSKETELPVRQVFRTDWRTVLLGIGALPVAVGGYYILTTFLTAYATGKDVGMSETAVLSALSFAAFVEIVATIIVSWLGDRVGARKIVVGGLIAVAVLATPQFLLMGTRNEALIFAMIVIMRIGLSGTYGPLPVILARMFTPRVRYTGISLSYQIAGAVFGGFAPIVCTALLTAMGNIWGVIILLIAMCLLGISCTLRAPRVGDTETAPAPAPAA
ncbi:MAG TPA: MFS transporter [Streptosporangiaceae bacterium]|jgi:metabolite-proton symporter